jgi:hypothetical protein
LVIKAVSASHSCANTNTTFIGIIYCSEPSNIIYRQNIHINPQVM